MIYLFFPWGSEAKAEHRHRALLRCLLKVFTRAAESQTCRSRKDSRTGQAWPPQHGRRGRVSHSSHVRLKGSPAAEPQHKAICSFAQEKPLLNCTRLHHRCCLGHRTQNMIQRRVWTERDSNRFYLTYFSETFCPTFHAGFDDPLTFHTFIYGHI